MESRLKTLLQSEVNVAFINTESNGVILRCDTIGSIEAYHRYAKQGGRSDSICLILVLSPGET